MNPLPTSSLTVAMAAGLLVSSTAEAADPLGPELAAPDRVAALGELQLEDLLVTSVSKKPERRFEAAAAVEVITGEEIRRSGFRTLADALRLGTGMEVGQVDANKWAISTRGFNDRYASKLLVLMDGRSVYTPTFNGVNWDVQDYLIEDVDRIEIIRGPGGTLWGANAVNGVVNIITKDSRETVGGIIDGGYGTEQTGFAGVRYGMPLGQPGTLRGYFKYSNHDDLALGDGDAFDHWDHAQAGFRTDWHLESNTLTLQSDYYYGHRAEQTIEPLPAPPYVETLKRDGLLERGANVLGRWVHDFDNGTDLEVQTYWDYFDRNITTFKDQLHTFDVSGQHRVRLPARQELVYGAEYRWWHDHAPQVDARRYLDPEDRDLELYSLFVQDEFTVVEDRLRLIGGTKLEYYDYTGWEWSPNIRLAYTPSERQTLWGAISRPVREPSRIEREVQLQFASPAPGRVFLRGQGNPNFGAEYLLSYELGYRIRPTDWFSVDLAGYLFDYTDLLGSELIRGPGPVPGSVEITARATNEGQARSAGVELAPVFEIQDWWRLRFGYAWFNLIEESDVAFSNEATPQHQLTAMSSMDLCHHISLDVFFHYQSELELYRVPAFADMNVRLAWKPVARLEVAVVGHNLLDDQHKEFGVNPGTVNMPVSEVQRGVYGELTFRF